MDHSPLENKAHGWGFSATYIEENAGSVPRPGKIQPDENQLLFTGLHS